MICTSDKIPMETDIPEYRFGHGFDVHALETGLPLWICGVHVPCAFGAKGHSDADAPLHALTDALLGASALGDIGKLFPDTDPAYKGISSLILLQRAYTLVACEGWRLGNADLTIALQAPKIAQYHDAMVQSIANCLSVSTSVISVKATTTEHLGFVGRGEGIAAWAVVSLVKP